MHRVLNTFFVTFVKELEFFYSLALVEAVTILVLDIVDKREAYMDVADV